MPTTSSAPTCCSRTSLRSTCSTYARRPITPKGHIPGAKQVEFSQWAAPENLAQLPKNQKIVVVCYSGNTADQVVTVLRMLDFDAAGLKFGMMGWDGTGKTDYLKYIKAANRQVTTR